ncbi:hypothetical protein BDB00DRAFT_790975 [Zychaea mexicana]|uniref:uncharacterized protein n=1 Tax=Zychaea mexicana TaxID=64656 RepID=UPI0022FE1195|nr:uncharacterized protein BDB00DRAFT_790975 [Zychaea mexicana]KAI9489553.1 hypothetical protein BDB00DRAFT_790975 [Zychaea mexicana]
MSSSIPSSTRASPTLLSDNKDKTAADSGSTVFHKDEFAFMRDFHRIVELMLDGANQEEIGKAVAQMDERFGNARRILQELPGLQYVEEEQDAILKRETTILETKKEQLKKYMELAPFNPEEDPAKTTTAINE